MKQRVADYIAEISDKYVKNKLLFILSVSVCLSYFIHLLLLVFVPVTHQLNIFFCEGGNFFADFFNCCIFTSTKDVYLTAKGFVCYLPLSYLLLFPFIKVVNFESLSLADCYANPQAMLCVLFFTALSLVVFLHSLYCLLKKYNVTVKLLIPLLLSNILIFTLERGNWVMIASALMNYFLAYYDSEEKKLRYFAATALVIASVLKIYPVLLGVLYLQKKDYRILIYCVLLGIPLSLLPFLVFKSGFNSIPAFLEQLKINSALYIKDSNPKFGVPYLFYGLGRVLEKYLSVKTGIALFLLTISTIVTRFICVYAIILSFKTKDFLYKLLLIIMVVLFVPAHSEYYCGLYLFPTIIIFIATLNERTKREKIYFILFYFILLQDIQIVFQWYNITRVIVDCVAILFFLYITIRTSIKLIEDKRAGK